MAKDMFAKRRAKYTKQAYQHALQSIRRDGRGHGAIPVASASQAFLEMKILERLGDWDPAGWAREILGYGVSWVDPSPEAIELGIPTRFLPDIALALMPVSGEEEMKRSADDDRAEVYGIPGLRYRSLDDRVILFVPGISGRVEIPIKDRGLWGKAVSIASHSWEGDTVFFWDESPEVWHPAEHAFVASFPEKHEVGNLFYRTSRLASDLLRRLPGICAPFIAHDMWFNYRREFGYSIEFEWQNSGAPHKVLDLLLDRRGGLRAGIDVGASGMPMSYFYSDDCNRVRLASDLGGCINLRHLQFTAAREYPLASAFGDIQRRKRLELECRYEFPSSEKFFY